MASFLDSTECCEFGQESYPDNQRNSTASLGLSSLPSLSSSYFSPPTSTLKSSLSVVTSGLDTKRGLLSPLYSKDAKKMVGFCKNTTFAFFERLEKVSNHCIDYFMQYDDTKTGCLSMDCIMQVLDTLNIKIKQQDLEEIFEGYVVPEGIDYLHAYRLYRARIQHITTIKQKKAMLRQKERRVTERHSITLPYCGSTLTPETPSRLYQGREEMDSFLSSSETPLNVEGRDSLPHELDPLKQDYSMTLSMPTEGSDSAIHTIFQTTLKSVPLSPEDLFERLYPINNYITIENLYNYVNSITYIPYSLEMVLRCFKNDLNVDRDCLTKEEFIHYLASSTAPPFNSSTTLSTSVNMDYILDTFHQDFGSQSLHIPICKSCPYPSAEEDYFCEPSQSCLKHTTSVTTNLYRLPFYDYVCKDHEFTDESDEEPVTF